MNFKLPAKNTHPEISKEQHLVPRTYMRAWAHDDKDHIWVYDSNSKKKQPEEKTVESINYKNGFHDIKIGDIFIPEEAMEELYGPLKAYKIVLGDKELTSLEAYRESYGDYDHWVITDMDGNIANKKEKNELKSILEQSRFTFIEKEWCEQFEKNWQEYINRFEERARCNVATTMYKLTWEEWQTLMEYTLVYDFRNEYGNSWVNQIMADILPEEIATLEIPYVERPHKFNKSAGDELKHATQIKAFYEYLKCREGKIALMIDQYIQNCGIQICLTNEQFPFITSNAPSMMIRRIDNSIQHIFVATPTMLITTYKKTQKSNFMCGYIKPKEVKRFNKYIAENSSLLISKNNDSDTAKIFQMYCNR